MASKLLRLAGILSLLLLGLWLIRGPLSATQAATTTSSQSLKLPCKPPKRIDWPSSSNPVWSLCWEFPWNSSGVDGSGLELTDVYYKGKKVFKRAGVPVVNVFYDSDSCGPSYRDWTTTTQAFEANNKKAPGYAEPTVPPKTVLDHPGYDAGNFDGMAAEKKSRELILTTQMSAGWYRYVQKWIFKLDGTIIPQFGFTAVDDACIHFKHHHNAYWRLDFDVDGPYSDEVSKVTEAGLQSLRQETSDPATNTWQVADRATGRGYEIQNSTTAANDSAVANFWALQYRGNELDDGGANWNLGALGDAAQMNRYVNGQRIDGRDLVVWSRGDFEHVHVDEGHVASLTLKPIGSW